MPLVVVENKLSCAPRSVAGRLGQVDTCSAKLLCERIDVIDAEVEVQMSSLLHECNGWIGSVHQFEMKAAAAGRPYARVKIGMPELELEPHLLCIEKNAAVEISRAQLGCNGYYWHGFPACG